MDDFTKFLFQTGLIVDIGEEDPLESDELNILGFHKTFMYDENENEDIIEDDEEDY